MRRLGTLFWMLASGCNLSALAPMPDAGAPDLLPMLRFRFAPTITTHAEGLSPIGMVTGDLNNDRRGDVIVACSPPVGVATPTGGIDTFLGEAGGAVGAARHADFPRGPESTGPALAVGDFDGDGNLDVAAVAQWDLWLYLGDGHGGLTGQDLHQGAVEVAGGDFNGDGNLDLVVVAVSNSLPAELVPLLNDGHGRFAVGAPTPTVIPGGLVAADLDRDGIHDLVVLGASDIRVLHGSRDGTFTLKQQWVADSPQWVALGDLNADGSLDVAVLGGPVDQGELYVALTGPGQVLSPPSVTAAPLGPVSIGAGLLAADLDGDGAMDLAIVGFDSGAKGSVALLPGDGRGGFGPPATLSAPDLSSLPYAAAADVNGDGWQDLVYTVQRSVAGAWTTFLSVMLNTGR